MERELKLWQIPAVLAVITFSVIFFIGCGDSSGGGSYTAPPRVVVITVSSDAIDNIVRQGGTYQFTAVSNGAPVAVTWSIDESYGVPAEGATEIDTDGVLTVDGQQSLGEIRVRAALVSNRRITGELDVTVALVPTVQSVSVSSNVEGGIFSGETITFTAIAHGENFPPQVFDWDIEIESGRHLQTSFGVTETHGNTAILNLALEQEPGRITIRAISRFDPEQYFDYVIVIEQPIVTALAIYPHDAEPSRRIDVRQGDESVSFRADVTGRGNFNRGVEWAVLAAGQTLADGWNVNAAEDGYFRLYVPEVQPYGIAALTLRATSLHDNSVTRDVPIDVIRGDLVPGSVQITPSEASLHRGESVQFSAVVGPSGVSQAVTWTIDGNASTGRTLTSGGLLTVGADHPYGTTFTVRATAFGTEVYATAVVTIPEPSGRVSVSGPAAGAFIRGAEGLQFNAAFGSETQGHLNERINWSIDAPNSGGATISDEGVLGIPDRHPYASSGSRFTVRAVSVYGGIEDGTLEVTVLPPTANLDITAPNRTFHRGAPGLQFTAAVTGTGNPETGVTWSIVGQHYPGTTIDGGLLSIPVTHPFTAPHNTITVRAVQNGTPGAAQTSTIIVERPTVSSVGMSGQSSVNRGHTGEFFPHVTPGEGHPADTVNWSITGSLNPQTRISNGVLTVASTERAHSIAVRATSTVDPSQFAERQVSIGGAPPDTGAWMNVVVGADHIIAISWMNTLYAWGRNSHWQIGDNSSADRAAPVQIDGGEDWLQIAGGWSHSAAIRSDGTLWAWGRLFSVPHDINPGTPLANLGDRPTQVGADRWRSVSAGWNNFMGIRDNGSLWAWGGGNNNNFAKLGLGPRNTPANSFEQVGEDYDWVTVSAGHSHSAGLRANGMIYTWGLNAQGQLGLGDTSARNTPTRVTVAGQPELRWQMVLAGNTFTVAIDENGRLWTWGNGENGRLGTGGTANRNTPAQVTHPNGLSWSNVSVTYNSGHVLAADSEGSLWAWGANGVTSSIRYGQLGDGSTQDRDIPVRVTAADGPNRWMSINSGGLFSLAIQTDGSLWAWGDNRYGQLGNGETSGTGVAHPNPIAVPAPPGLQ